MVMELDLYLSVQYIDVRLENELSRAQIRRWVKSALFMPCELTVRFVDEEEAQALNRDYRGKDYATNVLTFDYSENEDIAQADIVLSTDVLLAEAKAQGKPLKEHAAHLIIHGVLHAQGFDHETEVDAEEMEAVEAKLLKRFGIRDPYHTDD